MDRYKPTRRDNVVYGPAVDVEVSRNGLGHFLFESCKRFASNVFQVDSETGESETYAQIREKSANVASQMKKRGISSGDVVVVCSSNNMDVVVPIFATLFLNAVTSSIDPSISLRDTVHLLNLVRPKMIFVEPAALRLIEDALERLPFEVEVVVMGSHPGRAQLSDFLKRESDVEDFEPRILENDTETALIFFSSGTTGLPKAIECSNFAMMYATESISCYNINMKVGVHLSSFYWISAFIVTLMVMLQGGRKIICSRFDPHAMMQIFEKHKVTFSFLATPVAHTFTRENTSQYDTSSLETIIFGGGPLGAEPMENVRSLFPNTFVCLGYGQTEASGFISLFGKVHDELSKKNPSSCGVLSPALSAKIVDPDTEALLGPNDKGEIRIRGKCLLNGYRNGDASTTYDDDDGFFKTGDLGYFDENHCLYVCDRLKDMFKYQSWHIVPASLETVIYQHPAVQETVVVGVPHEIDGDHPMALVVLKPQCDDVTEAEIKEFVDQRVLEREKLRAGVRIVSKFPRTPTGKVVRRHVRQIVLNGGTLN